ncbi:MAG: FAD-dependent oxidoreductase [Candidatus Altiarchaeota archaeon]|nr:FAD-dependent oxidoreductase [Candidatus Altiarchaeota archaeon]
MIKEVDIAVVGGGPAGLAAAIAAKKNGAESVLIIERGESLGGILNQCIHEGFGVERFKEALTGPEYMQRFIDEVEELEIPCILNSMVLEITKERKLTVATSAGLQIINAKAVVLCMGCRERTRGQLCIPGTRPAGVYTAGTAQNFINLRGYEIGRTVVILGSGDIGLIMARRLTLEGAKVLAVAEIMPYSSGLPRNMAQCLSDFEIPLYLRHTVSQVHGKKRVEAVTISQVDEKWKPIKGTEKKIGCDTLLLSVGLIPENELSRGAGVDIDEATGGPIADENMQTSVEGIFACGNVLHVHDIVDYVSSEAEKAGKSAAEYAKGRLEKRDTIKTFAGPGVLYVLPHKVSAGCDVVFSLRAASPGRDKRLVLSCGGRVIKKIPKMKINPAEMIRFTLKREELSGFSEVRVEVEDGK